MDIEEHNEQICHYYKNPFPEVNDFVMTKVIDLTQEGTNVELPEYNYLAGYATSNELANKKGRKGKQVIFRIKINDLIPMRVISVDTNKKLVLLSRKHISEEESNALKEKFRYATSNNKICDEINALYRSYIKTNILQPQTESYDYARQILWDMYEKLLETDDNTTNQYNIFKKVYNQILENPTSILVEYDNDFKERILQSFSNRITYKQYCLETELIIFTTKGVTQLKEILEFINILNVDDIKVTTVANSPKYRITTEGKNLELLTNLTNNMVDKMKEICSQNNNGTINITYINKPTKDYNNEDMVQIKYLSSNEIKKLFLQ